jgi:hypothetical protein
MSQRYCSCQCPLQLNNMFITNSTDFFLAYAFFGVTLITFLLSLVLGKKIKWPLAKIIIFFFVIMLIVAAIWDINYDTSPKTEHDSNLTNIDVLVDNHKTLENSIEK